MKIVKTKQQIDTLRAYRRLSKSDFGKAVLEELASFCCYRYSNINPQIPDPHQVLVQEGQRRVFLHILDMIKESNDELAE